MKSKQSSLQYTYRQPPKNPSITSYSEMHNAKKQQQYQPLKTPRNGSPKQMRSPLKTQEILNQHFQDTLRNLQSELDKTTRITHPKRYQQILLMQEQQQHLHHHHQKKQNMNLPQCLTPQKQFNVSPSQKTYRLHQQVTEEDEYGLFAKQKTVSNQLSNFTTTRRQSEEQHIQQHQQHKYQYKGGSPEFAFNKRNQEMIVISPSQTNYSARQHLNTYGLNTESGKYSYRKPEQLPPAKMRIAEQHTPKKCLLQTLTQAVLSRRNDQSPLKAFMSVKPTQKLVNHQECKLKSMELEDKPKPVINKTVAQTARIIETQVERQNQICNNYMKPYESIMKKLQRLNNHSNIDVYDESSQEVLNGDIIETINQFGSTTKLNSQRRNVLNVYLKSKINQTESNIKGDHHRRQSNSNQDDHLNEEEDKEINSNEQYRRVVQYHPSISSTIRRTTTTNEQGDSPPYGEGQAPRLKKKVTISVEMNDILPSQSREGSSDEQPDDAMDDDDQNNQDQLE